MLQPKQEAGAVRVRAAGKWAVPGDDVRDGQAGHPVVGQRQVTVLLTAPVSRRQPLKQLKPGGEGSPGSPAETVSQLGTVLPQSSVQVSLDPLRTSVSELLCSSLLETGPEEDVGFAEEVPKTVGLSVGLCVALTVFHLVSQQQQQQRSSEHTEAD